MKNVIKYKGLFAMVLIPLFLIACGKGLDENKIKDEMNDAQQKLTLASNKIEQKIDNFKAELDSATADDSIEIKSSIDKLEALKIKTDSKMKELATTTADTWGEFKSGLNSFIEDVNNDFKSVVKEEQRPEERLSE